MAINKSFLLKVFKEASKKAPERKPGYHDALFSNLTNIIFHEYKHMTDGGNINKKIDQEIKELGDFLSKD